ncbi:MAG: hypothetical protein ACAI25_05400 [Planctomycetota bacterium]
MAGKKQIKIGGQDAYYVAIDGTDSIDSAAFGVAIEDLGVRNLYGEMLKDNVPEKGRLEDPGHTHLPIWQVAGSAGMSAAMKIDDPRVKKWGLKPLAVVCPCGFGSYGDEKFWPDKVKGLADSTKLMKEVILQPGVFLNADKKMALAAEKAGPGDKVISPQILTLSSHGWLGGFMKGNSGEVWMIIGGIAADKNLGFKGPLWLILAQCSTVCMATWPSWVKVFERSDPPVRGVLAYEEVAPAASEAGKFAKEFFDYQKKMSFLQAWKKVNDDHKRSWSAIVHEWAVDDNLSNAAKWKEITKADVKDAFANGTYRGWSQTPDAKAKAKGEAIVFKEEPFDLKLEMTRDDRKGAVEVNETNLHETRLKPKLRPDGSDRGYHYEVTIAPPLGATEHLVEATIEWVHIRRTKEKIKSSRIFVKAENPKGEATVDLVFTGTKKTDKNHYSVKPVSGKKIEEVVVSFVTQDSFKDVSTTDDHYKKDDKLVDHHSYLWLYVSLTTTAKKYGLYEFTTRGLVYNGNS